MRRLCYVLFLLFLVTPLLPLHVVCAATYYIDADSGSDLKPGTSAADAWAPLAKVNATTFLPDDRVLFKRGGHWSGQLAPRGSGTSGHAITLGAYGSGALPVVSGGGIVDSALALSNQSYWTVQNLEITNNPDKLTTDPLFVRPGSHADGFAACQGYRLKSASPCRRHGMAIPTNSGYDFFGDAVSPNRADIGAEATPAKSKTSAKTVAF